MSLEFNTINVEVRSFKKVIDLTEGNTEKILDISIWDSKGKEFFFKINSTSKLTKLMLEV